MYGPLLRAPRDAVPRDGGGTSGGCCMEEEGFGAAEMEVGRGALAATVAPELVLRGEAKVALHGDVGPRGRLPFEHPVSEGLFNGAGWCVIGLQ